MLLEERWVADAEKALSEANHVSTHEVDRDSVEQAKTRTPTPTPVSVHSQQICRRCGAGGDVPTRRVR
jgi:hypothetical protein